MKRLSWKALLGTATETARVLVVEDEEPVRRALSRLLITLGHSVETASSAEQADQRLQTERFDVCLLDIELPRMSGVEFLTWALLKDPEMAVIMLTGVDSPEVALECIDHGARTFLVKPIETEFLRRAIRDAVALRRLLVEHNDRADGTDVASDDPWRTSY